MARLTGFAWSKVASVGVSVNAFESRGNYAFNLKRVPKYLLSISGTSENKTSMETALPIMALVCIPSTSLTNSPNVLPISAELSSDTSPEEISSSRLSKISPVPKKKIATVFLSLKKLIMSRKREKSKGEIMKKSREMESINNPNTSGL
jgi:hypothetical protein